MIAACLGMLASAAGVIFACKLRNCELALFSMAASASIALPLLSTLAVEPAVEIVRFLAPAALVAAVVVSSLHDTERLRSRHLTLAIASTMWIVALLVPGAVGVLLAVEVLSLWMAFYFAARPLLGRVTQVVIDAWKADTTW